MAESRTLLLIRHSAPEIAPGAPAREWRLSEEGRRRCGPLAERAAAFAPRAIVSSVEPKAAETARLVGERLGIPIETAPGLHEHERDNVGYLGRASFAAAIADFFARPDALVLGREPAARALARFSAAVDGVLTAHPTGNLAIVAHGTVLTLFVAHHTGVEPYAFWRDLGLPALVALCLPEYTLLATDNASE